MNNLTKMEKMILRSYLLDAITKIKNQDNYENDYKQVGLLNCLNVINKKLKG